MELDAHLRRFGNSKVTFFHVASSVLGELDILRSPYHPLARENRVGVSNARAVTGRREGGEGGRRGAEGD